MHRQNLLFIIIDGLSQRELPLTGPAADLIPTFRDLAGGGYVANHCFAHGTPTEFAIPSLLSSTLPLDFGGYQYGLWNRPDSLFDRLRENGYRTGLFTKSFVLDRLFGFGRGLDFIQSFYDIESLWRYMRRTFLYHIRAARLGGGDEDHFYAHASEAINRFYATIHHYAAQMRGCVASGLNSPSRIYRHDFAGIMAGIEREFHRLEQDGRGYVDRNLETMMRTGLEEFLGLAPVGRRVRKLLSQFDGRCLPGSGTLFRGYEKNAPTEAVLDAAARWIDGGGTGSPFAATVHLMDIHDGLCSGDRYFIRQDPAVTRSYCREADETWPSLRHMQALAYVDRCLARFLAGLERAGLRDSLTIVITSDHGTVWHNRESCLASSTPPGSFKDIYLSIPFMMNGAGIPPRQDERLQQSMNITPSILHALGVDPGESFQGHSALDDNCHLAHVIAEHTHRGPCDPYRRPIYMGIRTDRHKYIWKESFSSHDRGPRLAEQLFDLAVDPDENNSVHDHPENRDIMERMRELRHRRVREIRAQPAYQLARQELLA